MSVRVRAARLRPGLRALQAQNGAENCPPRPRSAREVIKGKQTSEAVSLCCGKDLASNEEGSG